MIRSEALEDYKQAVRQGQKYYHDCILQGTFPYPQVLEQLLQNQETAGTVKLGLVDIPSERIIGTWAEGRKTAFAGNMMPLLDPTSEFGEKWIALCESHLEEGIRDPITCIEYLGSFYVQEGHKRVSVLKSFDAPTIPGIVTRVIPAPSDDVGIRIYYEFMRFYKLSQSYLVSFTKTGGYARLQAAMGLEPEQEWPEETRLQFNSSFRAFKAAFDALNTEKLPITAGDARGKGKEPAGPHPGHAAPARRVHIQFRPAEERLGVRARAGAEIPGGKAGRRGRRYRVPVRGRPRRDHGAGRRGGRERDLRHHAHADRRLPQGRRAA